MQLIIYLWQPLSFNLGLAETERPELLTRSFDREMLVKNISLYNFHIYDGVLQSKQSAQRALADSNSLTEIENYVAQIKQTVMKRRLVKQKDEMSF